MISLQDETGKIIHAVQYSSDWHENELKKNGGWSLEMIDTKNPCSGFGNWTSSKDENGGTPGRTNSVDRINRDESVPKILNTSVNNPTSITLNFNEPVDSSNSSLISNYTFDNQLSALNATAISPLFNKVNITINNPVTKGIIYR